MPFSHRSELPSAGVKHPVVREYFQTKRNRVPDAVGAVALEGLWAIRRAVDASVAIEAVFVCNALVRGADTDRLLRDVQAAGAVALQVTERVLRRMVDRDGPDGVAAIARLPTPSLDSLAVSDATGIVIADGFELIGNLGTLIRGADGAGMSAVVLTDRRVRVTHPLVVRASMGTVFSMPVIDAPAHETLAWLRRHDFRIVAADPHAPTSYRAVDYRGPLAIVLGSERRGLDPLWRAAAHHIVSIPMHGVADSLNVAVAGALLMYEALHHPNRH
ncbi:MAG TPA: RNA methyltransferase [Acidimicrobiia bacterium]|jgi:TrmH family RNA methyltransferase